LSVALAVTVTEPETVALLIGLMIDTIGGVVSGGGGGAPAASTSTALKFQRSVVGAVSFNVTTVLLEGVTPVVA
jgi:hypothetical protein